MNLGGCTTREQGSGSDKGCLHIGDKTQKSEKTKPVATKECEYLRWKQTIRDGWRWDEEQEREREVEEGWRLETERR